MSPQLLHRGSVRIHSPLNGGAACSTSLALAAALKLQMREAFAGLKSIRRAPARLMDSILAGHFALLQGQVGEEQNAPLGWVMYAFFDRRAEARYLENPAAPISADDWNSGDRMWLLHCSSPYGLALQFLTPLRSLLAHRSARLLSHRVLSTSPHAPHKVLVLRGKQCPPEATLAYWNQRQLAISPGMEHLNRCAQSA